MPRKKTAKKAAKKTVRKAAKNKTAKSEIEHELKILLSPNDLEKVFKSLKKKALRKKVEHKYMPRAYYDTKNLDLYRNSISVRMQYKPGKNGKIGFYEQTIKFDLPKGAEDEGDSLFRKECKDVMKDHEPALSKISDPDARKRAKKFVKKKVVHIFTAAIERRSFELTAGRGKKAGVVEVAFDVGEIILGSNGRRYPFSEIEVEVVRGSSAAMEIIGQKIRRMARSARNQPLSKAQQGSRLYRRTACKKK